MFPWACPWTVIIFDFNSPGSVRQLHLVSNTDGRGREPGAWECVSRMVSVFSTAGLQLSGYLGIGCRSGVPRITERKLLYHPAGCSEGTDFGFPEMCFYDNTGCLTCIYVFIYKTKPPLPHCLSCVHHFCITTFLWTACTLEFLLYINSVWNT